MGPYQYATHLISGPRLPFTATYFGAIALTIYSAVGVSPPPFRFACADIRHSFKILYSHCFVQSFSLLPLHGILSATSQWGVRVLDLQLELAPVGLLHG